MIITKTSVIRVTVNLSQIKEVCKGRSSCELHATDDEFEDPCPWTKKYLAVRYQCRH